MRTYQLSSPSYCAMNFWKSFSSRTNDLILSELFKDLWEAAEANLPSPFSLSCSNIEQNAE